MTHNLLKARVGSITIIRSLALSMALVSSCTFSANAQSGTLIQRTITNNIDNCETVVEPQTMTTIHLQRSQGRLTKEHASFTNENAALAKNSGNAKLLTGQVSKVGKNKKVFDPLSLKTSEDMFTCELLAGSTFPVELDEDVCSKTAKKGDFVTAHLIEDLYIGDRLIASAGSPLEGKVVRVYSACKGIKSNKMNRHFRNANGGVLVEFVKLYRSNGSTYDISAIPSPHSPVERYSDNVQKLSVEKNGELVVPYHAGRYTALALAISGGGMAAGPFGMAGAPALSALIGGICPAYGLGRPVHPDERYSRLKGALMGAVRGSPGGFITSGFFVRGLDVTASTGDQLTLVLQKNISISLPVTHLVYAHH